MTQAIGFCHVFGLLLRHRLGRGPVWDTRIGSTSLERARGTPHASGSPDPVLTDVAPYLSLDLPLTPGRAPGGLAILAGYAAGIGAR